MPRDARVVIPELPHHVTQRGTYHQKVFDTDADRTFYLTALRDHSMQGGLRLYGYCLMTNHVHLIVVPEKAASLARTLKAVHQVHSARINRNRGEVGHLWQGRYYSCPMDEQHVWRALRYVELNPVRANLIADAEQWHWSSARAHCQGYDPQGLIDMGDWHRQFEGFQWRRWLADPYEEEIAVRLREATRTGRRFGDRHPL